MGKLIESINRGFESKYGISTSRIDAARDRVATIRSRLKKEENLSEDYVPEFNYNGRFKSGKEAKLAHFFCDTIYHALDNIFIAAHSKIEGLPEGSDDESERVDRAIVNLADALVINYFDM